MRRAVALDHHLLAGLSGWPVPGPAPFRETFAAVSGRAFAAFLPGWQGVGSGGVGVAGLLDAVERLQGCAVPVGDLEGLVLPARVADFTPELLDGACRSGELLWAGRGPGHVALYLPRDAGLLLPPPTPVELSPTHAAVLAALDERALFFPALVTAVASRTTHPPPSPPPTGPPPREVTGPPREAGPPYGSTGGPPGSADGPLPPGSDVADRVLRALRELAWAGYVSNDTLAPVRAAAPDARPARATPPGGTGRWFRLPALDPDADRRAAAHADQSLRRYGVVTAGARAHPRPRPTPASGSGSVSPHDALTAHPAARPGCFVADLLPDRGGGQFAHRDALVPLRSAPAGHAVLLAATDPANPFGAALPWPGHPAGRSGPDHADRAGHRAPGAHPGHPESPGHAAHPGHAAGPGLQGHPGRHGGAVVVLVGGRLVLYAGAEVLWFTDDPGTRGRAARLVRGTSSRAGLVGPSDIGSGAPVPG